MPLYQLNQVNNISDIKAIADHAGSYFFSAGAMRAFSSRVLSGVVALDSNEAKNGNRFLFLTSEKYGDGEPRHYSVRIAKLGSIRDDRPHIDIQTYEGPFSSPQGARRRMEVLKSMANHPAGSDL